MTYDSEEKRLKAVQLGDVVRDMGYWRAVHNSFLSDEMKKLGYATEKHGKSFRIVVAKHDLRGAVGIRRASDGRRFGLGRIIIEGQP